MNLTKWISFYSIISFGLLTQFGDGSCSSCCLPFSITLLFSNTLILVISLLLSMKAVNLAAKKLPCVFCNCLSDRTGFSHFGYVVSSYAPQYVFRKVMRSMRLLESGASTLRCTWPLPRPPRATEDEGVGQSRSYGLNPWIMKRDKK